MSVQNHGSHLMRPRQTAARGPISSLQGHAQMLEFLGQWEFSSYTVLSKEE